MSLTSKQRKLLEALAHDLEPVVRIGKGGITPTLVKTVDEALQARELIKVKILDNAEVEKDEAAEDLVAGTSCQLVRTIGRVLVLYRANPKKKNPIDFRAPPKGEEALEDDQPKTAVRKATAKKDPRKRPGKSKSRS